MKNTIEYRTVHEVRAAGDEGIIEGHIVKWDDIDSYRSSFVRGSFKRTINGRMHKIRVLFNHNNANSGNPSNDVPIGKLLEIREDEVGVFVRVQLILSIRKAAETFEAIKAEAIDSFSFGFRTIKETFKNKVRVISEVKLFEVSPVIFEANEASLITGARSMENELEDETRNTDFAETDEWKELYRRGPRLIDSLWETLNDIWWTDVEDKVASIDEAIGAFQAAYVTWANEVTAMAETRSSEVMCTTELATEFNKYLKVEGKTLEDMASTTDFNINELRALRSGKIILAPQKLEGLPEEMRTAHKKARSKAAEALFSELRSGICPAEATRMVALLKQSEPAPSLDSTGLVSHLETFSKSLTEQEN